VGLNVGVKVRVGVLTAVAGWQISPIQEGATPVLGSAVVDEVYSLTGYPR
jgi:hypothetical protein